MEYITSAPKGAALLDEKRPGWADEIDLEAFEIGSIFDCVLGQLYENYSVGLTALFGSIETAAQHEEHPAYTHGFDRHTDALFSWAAFQAEWEALITERKSA